eukprot:CAMPEP_0117532596 /NCGR_PEP_ID=MMETSP0784-20121206/39449_1 /TAXON_ID=39447 /ORGANISM="" /LENGTH=358 /DNA_ID=CAMNT_0005328993 /DNA_START=18 /DNA_END=1090 /DNA_ORIENTATION=+
MSLAQVTERVLKVAFRGELQRLTVTLGHGAAAAARLAAIRTQIQRSFGLPDAAVAELVLRYADDDGDLCTLNEHTLSDWVAVHAEGVLRLNAELPSFGASGASLAKAGGSNAEEVAGGASLAKAGGSNAEEAAGTQSLSISRLSQAARNPDEHVRRSASNALCEKASAGDADALSALEHLANSTDEAVRRMCAQTSVAVGGASAAKGLLSNNDEEIRRLASAALGQHLAQSKELGEPPAKQPRHEKDTAELKPSSSSADFEALRRRAAAGDMAALNVLQAMTEDPVERVRRDAVDAIVGVATSGGSEAFAVLAALARHSDEHIRRKAAEALAAAAAGGRDVAVVALGSLAWHDDEHVR